MMKGRAVGGFPGIPAKMTPPVSAVSPRARDGVKRFYSGLVWGRWGELAEDWFSCMGSPPDEPLCVCVCVFSVSLLPGPTDLQ